MQFDDTTQCIHGWKSSFKNSKYERFKNINLKENYLQWKLKYTDKSCDDYDMNNNKLKQLVNQINLEKCIYFLMTVAIIIKQKFFLLSKELSFM